MITGKTIVTREEIIYLLALERTFIERWTSDDTESQFRAGKLKTPPMPRIEGIGKGTRFHLKTVEDWLLRHFQKGGDPAKP